MPTLSLPSPNPLHHPISGLVAAVESQLQSGPLEKGNSKMGQRQSASLSSWSHEFAKEMKFLIFPSYCLYYVDFILNFIKEVEGPENMVMYM